MPRIVDANRAIAVLNEFKVPDKSNGHEQGINRGINLACWVLSNDSAVPSLKEDKEKLVYQSEWELKVKSFYADNWDESIELVIYITAKCAHCGQEHYRKEVFSKHLYASEDAEEDFRFDRAYEEAQALEEFEKKNYKFQNYCPNCGCKMIGHKVHKVGE